MPVAQAQSSQSSGAAMPASAAVEDDESLQDPLQRSNQLAMLSQAPNGIANAQTPKGERPSGPTITTGSNSDHATEVTDVIAAGQATGASVAGGAKVVGMLGVSGEVLDVIGVAGEFIGFVGLGLQVFGLAENAIRLRDAKIRFGAFTAAYEKLAENDPVRPYLEQAAAQQKWETKRRWARVGVTAAVIALTTAALIVGVATTGGLILAAVGAVLSVAKGCETVKNFFAKRAAKKTQQKMARELLTEGFENGGNGTAVELTEMLQTLKVPVPTMDNGKLNKKELDKAVSKLAPHLARTEAAHQEALQQRATQIREDSDAAADSAIAADG
jgi:hypothetical protein